MIVESSSRPVVVTVLSCSKLLGLLKTWHEKGIFVLDHDMNCQSHIINGSNLEYKVLQRYKFWYGCSWFFSIWREFLFKHFAGRKKKYESFFDIINWWNDPLQNLTTNFFEINNHTTFQENSVQERIEIIISDFYFRQKLSFEFWHLFCLRIIHQ